MGFEFSSKSWLADKIITLFNENMDQWEKDNQCVRLKPGELLTIFKGKEVVIPLLKPEWAKQLVNWPYWAQLKPEFENQILQILKKIDTKATITDVRQLVNQRNLLPQSTGFRWNNFEIPEGLGDPKKTSSFSKRTIENPEVPFMVRDELMNYLIAAEKFSREKAYAVIDTLAQVRSKFCPLKKDITPGQVAWIGMDATEFAPFRVKTADRLQRPLLLTLYTKQEIEIAKQIKTLDEFYKLILCRMERICFEAYQQGAVLEQQGIHLMFFLQQPTISKLVRKYMEFTNIILPIAGTIKDAGRSMTHKKIIIDQHLKGFLCNQIAQSTKHDQESIDKYLEVFKSVLILFLFNLPVDLTAMILNRSIRLIEEHIDIIESYFEDRDDIIEYLRDQRIQVPFK